MHIHMVFSILDDDRRFRSRDSGKGEGTHGMHSPFSTFSRTSGPNHPPSPSLPNPFSIHETKVNRIPFLCCLESGHRERRTHDAAASCVNGRRQPIRDSCHVLHLMLWSRVSYAAPSPLPPPTTSSLIRMHTHRIPFPS